MLTIVGIVVLDSREGRAQAGRPNPLRQLLESEKALFGVFSEKTPEAAARLAPDELVELVDFVFYDMETGPFDLEGMAAFMKSLGARPIVTRLPPIGEGLELAEVRSRDLLDRGVQGVVFPHVEDREQAELASKSMAKERAISILIIEDRLGVGNAREIVATPGIDVVFAGPGDLRRAYEGDGTAVENAIQTILSACKEQGVAWHHRRPSGYRKASRRRLPRYHRRKPRSPSHRATGRGTLIAAVRKWSESDGNAHGLDQERAARARHGPPHPSAPLPVGAPTGTRLGTRRRRTHL